MKNGVYHGKDRHATDSEWQLQEAKACLSEVVRRSQQQPQRVTVHGKPSAVVVSAEFFDRMLPESGADLIELMTQAASGELEFGEGGEAMPVREVEL
ncbi:MAG: prevent-host-death family protein [Candidatus Azotimanducaceae bacterium]|jgi:prevent-host-death family protein